MTFTPAQVQKWLETVKAAKVEFDKIVPEGATRHQACRKAEP